MFGSATLLQNVESPSHDLSQRDVSFIRELLEAIHGFQSVNPLL